MRIKKLISLVSLILVFQVSIYLIYIYLRNIILPHKIGIDALVEMYHNGKIGSPFTYRVLFFEAIIFIKSFIPILKFWQILSGLMYFTFLFSIYQLKKIYEIILPKEHELFAIILSAIFISVTFFDHAFQPWSYLDIGLYALSYRIMKYEKNFLFFILLIIISILNRETGVFVGLMYIINSLIEGLDKKGFLKIFLVGMICLSVSFFLRSIKGYHIQDDGQRLTEIFNRNIELNNLTLTIFAFFASGLFFVLPFKKSRLNILDILLTFLFFIPFYLIFGIWFEIRMLLPFTFMFIFILLTKIYEISERFN